MEINNNYDLFKEDCTTFVDEFNKIAFENASVVAHPTAENVFMTPCDEEEARTNGLDICRMADMFLMSTDNENWESFTIAKARELALDNGFIYICDLLKRSSFYAEEWMLNGKNDTIVVSEDYMKEKGKKYAPVTPLTNKVLQYKKLTNKFLWTKSESLDVTPLTEEYISAQIDAYFEEISAEIPVFDISQTQEFPLFDTVINITGGQLTLMQIDNLFVKAEEIATVLDEASDVFTYCNYDFSITDFVVKFFCKVLEANGVAITKEDFVEIYLDDVISENGALIEDICFAFLTIIKEYFKALDEVAVPDYSEYISNMKTLEQTAYNGFADESVRKNLITKMLSEKPADFVIFYYVKKCYPTQAENIEKIAEFYGYDLSQKVELQSQVYSFYLTSDLFDEAGDFTAGLEQSIIVRNMLVNANKLYDFTDNGYVNQLSEYIEDLDVARRSFGGTVFETEDAMKLAVINEAELKYLCEDLSALDYDELEKLQKHINGITVDDVTKAKYLLKVKIAFNTCEENMLEQLCLDVSLLEKSKLAILLAKVKALDYAESVTAPKISLINDYLLLAQKNELEAVYAGVSKMTNEEIKSLLQKITSEDYDEKLLEVYTNKINEFFYNRINDEIAEICNGMEYFDLEQLAKTKTALSEKIDEIYLAEVYSKIDVLCESYTAREEKRKLQEMTDELEAKFEGIEEFDLEKLAVLKADVLENYEVISEGFINRITEAVTIIEDAAFNKLVNSTLEMSADELELFKDEIECDHEKLGDDKYAFAMRYISTREIVIESEELEKIVENIEDFDFGMTYEALDKMENFNCNPQNDEKKANYIELLNNNISNLYIKDLEDVVYGYINLDKTELTALIEKIEAYDCPDEHKAKFIDDIQNHILKLMEDELIAICGNIDEHSLKKSQEIFTKVRVSTLDEELKNKYLDKIELHITDIVKKKQYEFITFLTGKLAEFDIQTDSIYIPTFSLLFEEKYIAATLQYVSTGRYEQPIYLHEVVAECGFTLTTEFFYAIIKGETIKIKSDDIVSFQAKKTMRNSVLVVTQKDGSVLEFPTNINKNNVELMCRALTALANFIREKNTAEYMREMLEVSTPEKQEEPAPAAKKFCTECGATILNPNAKFCAECGTRF